MHKITTTGLRKFNLIMAGLHGLQALAIVSMGVDFKLPITGAYLKFNQATQGLEPATEILFELPLVWLIVGFLLLSAIAHLFIATVYNPIYNKNLAKGMNKARWIEYAFSASTMMVAIAMLVGVYDAASLLMIFVLTAVMNLMGLVMEVHNQTTKKTNWLSYMIGVLAGIAPWLVVALYFWLSAENGSRPPTFVYWIFVSIFLFFNCFAVNMILQYKKLGPWRNYLYGEKVYIILSLVAKSALAWQVFAGTLRP